jgi:hypothetical protein
MTNLTTIIHRRDPNGREIVGIPLSNRPGSHAWLYADDHRRVVAMIGQSRWFANRNTKGQEYVRASCPRTGRNVMIARLIEGDWARTAIRYRDGNRLNLRGINLEAQAGTGGCRIRVKATRRPVRPSATAEAAHAA